MCMATDTCLNHGPSELLFSLDPLAPYQQTGHILDDDFGSEAGEFFL